MKGSFGNTPLEYFKLHAENVRAVISKSYSSEKVNTMHFLVKTLLLFSFLLSGFNSFSQTDLVSADTIQPDTIAINKTGNDTIQIPEFEQLKELALTAAKISESNYNRNQLVQQQVKSFNQIEFEIQNANSILEQGIDYARFTEELNAIMKYKEVAVQGILINEDKYLTIRNLTTTGILLSEILNQTEHKLKEIKENNIRLTAVQHNLDSLVADKSIYRVPEDSVSKRIYYQRLLSMNKDVGSLNLRLKNAIDSIQNLEILSNNFKFNLQSDIAETNNLQKEKYDRFFVSKYKIFTERNPRKIDFVNSIVYSYSRGVLLLQFYFSNHWVKIVVLLLLIVAISGYLKILKEKYVRAGLYKEFKFPVQILNHPIATATLISITLYQFFLPLPPFFLTGILWIISGLALTIIFHKSENKFILHTWLVFFLLNIVAIFDHLLLIHTIEEAWLIFILSVSAFGFGIFTIFRRKDFDNKPKIWIISGMIFLELCSIIFLLMGNYNTGKIFMSEGLYAILVGYLLINTFRLSRNIFNFSEYLKESDEEKKLDSLKNRPGKISITSFIFFLIGWVILVTRNSYLYQKSTEPFKNLLSDTRQIGEFAFSYEGIITFFLVLFLSGFISKIVSFLADDKRIKTTGSKKSGLGSWLLLVRIGIITTGIIIAFRSAGFPTDRLTIIISALGVGIGFGMQTLVNNLVSGLIIAFEKPINVEDIVEIGGQTGKMKSIGIRSSVLSTWDGSDVIIPNGDLLNQHLVNWTLGSNKRRTEIQVGIAYGTDLEKAKSLISKVLSENRQVLKNPQPSIIFTTFNDSSIDVSIKYWISHFIYMNDIRSELIVAVNKVFNENGIVIPFPQRDIHIQTDTASNMKVAGKKEDKEGEV